MDEPPSPDPAAHPEAAPPLRLSADFLDAFVHDLRNPLSAMLGWIEVLGSGGGQGVENAVQALRRSVDQQDQTLIRMLELAALQNGAVRLTDEDLAVLPLAEAALAQARTVAGGKRVGLALAADASLPMLRGDPARLEQLLVGLLENGIRNAREGGLVQAALSHEDGALHFRVSDSGRGLRAEDCALKAARLGQPGGPIRGIGVALALVRELAHLQGGCVAVASQGPGTGSCYTLSLPAAGRA